MSPILKFLRPFSPPGRIVFLLGLVTALVLCADHAAAEQVVLPRAPYCQSLAFSSWSAPEKWVWQRVCEGAVADFNSHYGVTLNPRNRIGWSMTREIGTEFMHDVLARKHLRDAIFVGGVASIKGAWFREPVILDSIVVKGVLNLEQSRFESTLALNYTKVAHRISLDGSKVSGALYMHAFEANGSTSMRDGEYSDIILSQAKISNFVLSGSKVAGSLDMSEAVIRNHLDLNNSDAKDIFLNGAKVGGVLDLRAAKVKSNLSLQSLDVRGTLLMGGQFTDVDLFGATIGRNLELIGATVAGKLEIPGADIGGHLVIEGKFGDVSLYGARVSGDLTLRATLRGTLDMESIDVGRALVIDQPARYKDVMLFNAKVGSYLILHDSTVTGRLYMDALMVGADLTIYNGYFKDVSLNGAHIGGMLNIRASRVSGAMDMAGLKVSGELFIGQGAQITEVNLPAAKIGTRLHLDGLVATKIVMSDMDVGSYLSVANAKCGDADLSGSKIGAFLDFEAARVSGSLHMVSLVAGKVEMDEKSHFGSVDLQNATIMDFAALNGATISGELNIDSADIKGDLEMNDGHFRDVSLYGTKIGGDLVVKSEITNSFRADMAYVGGRVVLAGAQMPRAVEIFNSEFGSDLDLSGTQLTELRLEGTRVARELILGSQDLEPPHWTPGESVVTFRNTSADTLRFRYDSWPDEIDIEGFTYKRIREHLDAQVPDVGPSPDGTMPVDDTIDSLKEWLKKNKQYSPQPYVQLASVLRRKGLSDEANDILYSGKEEERSIATGAWWLWLTLLDWAVGYGYGLRYFRSLGWIAILVAFGTIVLWATGELRRHQELRWGIIYSLDMLLPFDLDKSHDGIPLGLCARRYFYAHKILGYVLSGFLIAGLAGITK